MSARTRSSTRSWSGVGLKSYTRATLLDWATGYPCRQLDNERWAPQAEKRCHFPGRERMPMRRLLSALFTGFVLVLAACTNAAPQGGQQQPAAPAGVQPTAATKAADK